MKKPISLFVALAAAASLLLAPLSGPAGAATRFRFYGSGFGHGIGMSQYGTLGLARRGWTGGRILRHYYAGTRVARHAPPKPTIRVGLLQNATNATLVAVAGAYELWHGGSRVHTVADGTRRRIEIASGQYRVWRGTNLVGTFDGSRDLFARRAPGRIRVAEWGHEIAHGQLRFRVVAASKAHLHAAMGVEEYVRGIAEVPNLWHRVALNVQAIAARTFAYWRLAGGPRAGCFCDVLPSTADQYYIGWSKESSPYGGRWVRAVSDTGRTVVTYGGKFIYAAYSSSSGGFIENIEKVWPGAQPLPYLRARCDPGDFIRDNPSRTWAVSFDASTLTQRLRRYTGNIGTVRGFRDYQRGASGRVTYVRVVGSTGTKVVRGWDVRSALSLRDTRFTINRNLNIVGKIRTRYDRLMCRPGQARSPQRRVTGGAWQKFVHGRMYENANRNRVVWLRGRVLRKYVSLGSHRSRLRLPYAYRKVSGGWRGLFDGGTITCTPGCRVRYS